MESTSPLIRDPITPALNIVVPCFNEQDVLVETAARLDQVIQTLVGGGQIASASGVTLVDDGSSDRTWAIIEQLSQSSGRISGLKLARNFGHQSAILAGMLASEGDVTITIDADLQDPPEVIARMVAAHREGAGVVYGVRDDRTSDSTFKRVTAQGYYKLMQSMGVDLIFNHADFRLMDRKAISALRQFSETNLFLRGLVPLLGFKQATVFYKREARFAGQSKYNLRKMLLLSIDGITSFSVFPLRIITLIGLLVSVLAFAAGLWAFTAWMLDARLVPGWTSVVLPVYFLGGIQLLSIGILGEYLGKNYFESKRRPRYIVEKTIGRNAAAGLPPAAQPQRQEDRPVV